MNRKIIETDIEQLSKTVKAMESKQERDLKKAVQQYNKVVQQNKDLQTELNTVKQQYNCYACGRCKGKEDYINLEKHHNGLRKQFDKQHKALEEIQAIAGKSKNYSSTATKIYEKCSEVL